jgi:hypothetical protein
MEVDSVPWWRHKWNNTTYTTALKPFSMAKRRSGRSAIRSVLRHLNSLFPKPILQWLRSIASSRNFQLISFPWYHPTAAYVFFLVFSSVIPCLRQRVLEGRFIRKMWPIQLALLHCIVCRILIKRCYFPAISQETLLYCALVCVCVTERELHIHYCHHWRQFMDLYSHFHGTVRERKSSLW